MGDYLGPVRTISFTGSHDEVRVSFDISAGSLTGSLNTIPYQNPEF